MKRYKNILASTILLSGPLLLAGITQAQGQQGADSFFDVFFEPVLEAVINRPIVIGKASLLVPNTEGSSTVDIEIVAMNLMSHGPKEGPTKHLATIMYSVSNLGPSSLDGVGFVEILMTCSGTREADSCVIDSTKPISKTDFRGHVTVLK